MGRFALPALMICVALGVALFTPGPATTSPRPAGAQSLVGARNLIVTGVLVETSLFDEAGEVVGTLTPDMPGVFPAAVVSLSADGMLGIVFKDRRVYLRQSDASATLERCPLQLFGAQPVRAAVKCDGQEGRQTCDCLRDRLPPPELTTVEALSAQFGIPICPGDRRC